MNKIHKQQLHNSYPACYEIVVNLPIHSKILTLAIDPKNDNVHIWYQFNELDENVLEQRKFFRFGTGWEIEEGLQYISTVFQGQFVWHYFEKAS